MTSSRIFGTIRLGLVLLAASATAGLITQAMASVPGPEQIVSYGFESPGDTFQSIGPSARPGIGDLVTTAFWGPTSHTRNSGTYSLWCAGTDAATVGASTFWPFYPEGTRGYARSKIPELADYYSVTASMAYTMPSIGGEDDWFRIGWRTYDASDDTIVSQFEDFFVSDTWRPISFDLSKQGNRLRLTRQAAEVYLQFNDSSASVPETGTGPSVDDFTVLAYKYGPVRSLAAAGSAGGPVSLSWMRPYGAVGSSLDETRAITYRVWRAEAGTSDFVELTSNAARATSNTFPAGAAPTAGRYKYVAQAWDTGTGTGRGQASPVVFWPAVYPAELNAPQKPSLTVYRWRPVTLTGMLPVHSHATTIAIECSRNTVSTVSTFVATVATGSATYSVPGVKLPATGTWYVRARHADETHSESRSAWMTVTVSGSLSLSAPKSATKMRVNKTYTAYGTVKPVHSKTSYFKVRAYRWNGRTYAYVKSFSVKLTTSKQPADTAKYTASVKLTKTGKWKLKLKHYAHGEEPEQYSSYSSRITVK